MTTSLNKNHWYDGRFYDTVIAPNQDRVFGRIGHFIKDRSTVLDVGCGTGRLAFQLQHKCSKVDGVDLSRRNVEFARKRLAQWPTPVVAFHHTGILSFLQASKRHYDYAEITYILHEMEIHDRIATLRALARAAHELIIVDYLVPQPKTLPGLLNTVLERAAGHEHYRNFRSFARTNGLAGLVDGAGLRVVDEVVGTPAGAHIVVARAQHHQSPSSDHFL